jgi:hypothetical protein
MNRTAFLTIIFLLGLPISAHSQSVPFEPQPEKQVHWALAAFFGTGWYRVDENRSSFIFRIPPRQTVRKAGWNADGSRRLGVEIQYPLALGLHRLDDIPDFVEFENYGSITFTPGVQVEIPVNERLSLRPYAHLGFGYEKESDEWAGIWYGGLKSRYLLGESEKLRWSLLNSLNYAGYKPEYKKRGQYASVMAGLEFNQPLGDFRLMGEPAWLNWHITYNYLFDRLNFHVDEDRVESIDDQWEVGLALSRGSKGVKLWFITFEHVGLAYRQSSNGKYKAITFNLRSPFTY